PASPRLRRVRLRAAPRGERRVRGDPRPGAGEHAPSRDRGRGAVGVAGAHRCAPRAERERDRVKKVERGGRHPARRVALQTLFEIDFNRGDPKETWTRGSFRAGLTEEAASFAWSIVEGV